MNRTVWRVLTIRELKFGDPLGTASRIWVADINVGGNRILRDVPIKGNAPGSRFYAARGQSVLMKRNANGRFDVVGPADRTLGIEVKKEYDLTTQTIDTQSNLGFSFRAEVFEFYKGPTPPTAGTSIWNDGSTPFPKTTTIDANGNEV